MKFPVFDLHCDTACAILGGNFRGEGNLKKNTFHIDLERASQLDGYAQCFTCFTTTLGEYPGRLTAADVFERELSVILREVEKNNDMIRLVYSAEEVEKNLEEGLMSAILTIEGPAGFGFDPALLEDLYKVGFRITTLGWNEQNVLCGSHVTGGGLTDLGKEYVKEAQRLGMMIDVSHISDEAFWDIIKITEAPVIASHSNSRAVYDCSRNLTDDMFRAICETGGVAGFNQYAAFVAENADLDKVCEHFLHFAEMDPSVKHIALGADLDGCSALPQGFAGVQDYPHLSDKLLSSGFSEETVRDIFWNNALGVMKRCCM